MTTTNPDLTDLIARTETAYGAELHAEIEARDRLSQHLAGDAEAQAMLRCLDNEETEFYFTAGALLRLMKALPGPGFARIFADALVPESTPESVVECTLQMAAQLPAATPA
jgi:hypothetical protein